MGVQEFCHITDGTLLKPSSPGDDWAVQWLLLSSSADFCIDFEPFIVFRMSSSLECKFLAQFVPSFI